jgi:Zn-dependent metalloprotease
VRGRVGGDQEVGEPGALDDLVALLDGEWHTALSTVFDEVHPIRVGVISRLPLGDVQDVDAFQAPLRAVQSGDGAGSNQAVMGRGALHVRVTAHGTQIDLVCCHLKSKLLQFPGGFQPADEGERARFGAYDEPLAASPLSGRCSPGPRTADSRSAPLQPGLQRPPRAHRPHPGQQGPPRRRDGRRHRRPGPALDHERLGAATRRDRLGPFARDRADHPQLDRDSEARMHAHDHARHRTSCQIAPPNLLLKIAEQGNAKQRDAALRTIMASAALRAQRSTLKYTLRSLDVGVAELAFLAPQAHAHLTVYDAQNGGDSQLPGVRVRGEGDPPAQDVAVNEAYDGAQTTYDFYKEVFERDSVDDAGLELVSSVHFLTDYDNAAWTGAQMVYGDGGGGMFVRGGMTKAIDVIGHELTHGVTDFTAKLEYHKQPGALNESFSDAFGSLVKQRGLGQTADEADWLIGEGILDPALNGVALRSMKAPGTAHAFDDQPAHMDQYQDLPDDANPRNDHGGVHINSGIPNHAFFLVATTIGGNAWEAPGRIWYQTLTTRLGPESDFREAADATVDVAGDLFGADGAEQQAVRDAWSAVGVL